MDISSIKSIAAYGMDLERNRLEAAGLNISTANQPLKSGQVARQFSVDTNSDMAADGEIQNSISLIATPIASKQVYMPNNVSADEAGMVNYPDVDVTQQLIDVSTATRAYEANIRIYNSASSMSKKLLEIGAK
ncbi:flagellar basal body rod protein FlgC [Pseudaeromonas pectinilytica]